MVDFPNTLDTAIAQAQAATHAAIAAGYTRLQVEILLTELKPMAPARQFISSFSDRGEGLKVFFPDAGAAALARRDWGDLPHQLRSLDVAGSRQTSTVEELVDSKDEIFLFVAPTSVEVPPVEQICTAAGDRPVILFNPRLEDVGTVGIGYVARQVRNRFLNTFEPCYYLCPLEGAAILRCYPAPWQVWQETNEGYTLIAEELLKPTSEKLETIFRQAAPQQKSSGKGLLAEMQRLFRALSQ
jgi:hypothetical protein